LRFAHSYDADLPLWKFFSSFYYRYNPSKNREDIDMAVYHWNSDQHLEQLFAELSKKYDIKSGQLKREYEAHCNDANGGSKSGALSLICRTIADADI
jgi:hypothetical protein